MLLDALRYIRGYVSFTVRGRFPERFINITTKKGIRVWGVTRGGDSFTACMYMADYRHIRTAARSAGVRLSIEEKLGLPTAAKKWRGRSGVFIGVFVFILTVFVMSQFIWCVEITGLESVSESEMRSLLSSHGLYIGACKIGLDYTGVSRAVMLDESKVGWMAVNVTGSYASVEIKEEATAPEIPDIKEPCNVKASHDGTIIRINAAEGDILLKEGSGVVKGQLVVSGVMDDLMGGVRLVRANAEIIAETVYEAEFSVPESYFALMPTGETGERQSLYLLGLRLPLTVDTVGSQFQAVSDRLYSLSPLDTALPVGLIRETAAALYETQIQLNDYSAEELLVRYSQLYELFTLSRCRVKERTADFSHSGGEYKLRVKYTCEEDIAYQEVIGTDEGTYRLRLPAKPDDQE